MKQKRKGICLLILGTMLLGAALFLVFYNLNEDKEGQAAADSVLTALKAQLPTPPEPDAAELPDFTEDLFAKYDEEAEAIPEETLIEVDGMLYLGYISIPALGIELPVLNEWSYPNLKISPCRYKGTVYTGDLIVAAHNYRSHFGRIQALNSGDLILFTDGDGVTHRYAVLQTEMLGGRDIEAMSFGSAEDWDLTLFTCTVGGQSRVTVRAAAVE